MKKNKIIQGILWLLEGVIVGFGAIMPGVSGGALCVAFGMYKPLIGILSDPKTSIKKHWKMLGVFLLGGAIGFIGLSGVADWLMLKNSQAEAWKWYLTSVEYMEQTRKCVKPYQQVLWKWVSDRQ